MGPLTQSTRSSSCAEREEHGDRLVVYPASDTDRPSPAVARLVSTFKKLPLIEADVLKHKKPAENVLPGHMLIDLSPCRAVSMTAWLQLAGSMYGWSRMGISELPHMVHGTHTLSEVGSAVRFTK